MQNFIYTIVSYLAIGALIALGMYGANQFLGPPKAQVFVSVCHETAGDPKNAVTCDLFEKTESGYEKRN